MKKLFGLLILSFLTLFFTCKNKSSSGNATSIKMPEGNFLNESYLLSAKDSLPIGMQLYCIEVIFNGTDSAEFSNGFETFYLKMDRVADTLLFRKAFRTGEKWEHLKAIIINKDEIKFMDNAYTHRTHPSTFTKTAIENNEKWKFIYALNKTMIAGDYSVLSVAKKDTLSVRFQEDGLLSGWDSFTEYEICFAGDCLGESKEPGNLLYLHDLRGKVNPFLITRRDNEGLFELYALGPINPEIKGEREKGPLTFIMQRNSGKKPNRSKGVF